VPIAGEQADAIAGTVNEQAEAVMLDFVNPIRRRGNHRAPRRDGGLELHSEKISGMTRIASVASFID